MSEYNRNPQSTAEELIDSVFSKLESQTDSQIARLHLENKLKNRPVRRRISTPIKVLAFLTALLIFSGWASQQSFTAWDDAQLINIKAPQGFTPATYPHWTGLFANYSNELQDLGGQSLIVDYMQDQNGNYYLQLGIIGINYSEANTWLRSVMEREAELANKPYSITQPTVSYKMTVREMIAFDMLGFSSEAHFENVKLKVVEAWKAAPTHSSAELGKDAKLYLITGSNEFPQRISTLAY